jgi:sugar lactone lactonase YvrE
MPAAPVRLLDGVKFPEGPRWHAGSLWFSDIHDHKVYRVDGGGHADLIAEFDDMPSGLGWLPDDTLLVVLMRQRMIVKVVDGQVLPHADLAGFPGDYLNDMVVDRQGNAYTGSITYRGFSSEEMAARSSSQSDGIVFTRPDGSTTLAAADVIGPNGSVITPDGQTLIVAETRAFRITAFDIADDGTLQNRRLFADLHPLRADGMALDAEGALWCGLGQYFGRVVEGGEIVDRIHVSEGKNAVACALGGPDRKTLYMATNISTMENLGRIHRAGATLEDDLRSDAIGWIEVATVDVPGAGLP